jgi:hypothetical protein
MLAAMQTNSVYLLALLDYPQVDLTITNMKGQTVCNILERADMASMFAYSTYFTPANKKALSVISRMLQTEAKNRYHASVQKATKMPKTESG